MRVLSFSTVIAAIATTAACAPAEELLVQRSYAYSDEAFLLKDSACLTAFESEVVPSFRGLHTVVLQSSNIFDTTDGAIAVYSNANFKGDYGNAEGSISCIFAANKITVTDVAVTFFGSGLGGFERRGRTSPSDDPADWKVSGFSTQILP